MLFYRLGEMFLYSLRSIMALRIRSCVFATRALLRRVHDRLAPAELVATEHATAFWRSSAIHAAVELDLARHLAKGPLTIDELAAASRSSPQLLGRLLQALSSIGFFQAVKGPVTGDRYQQEYEQRYEHSRLSRTLIRCNDNGADDVPKLGWAILFQRQVQWDNWRQLAACVSEAQTSSSARNSKHRSLFEALEDSPKDQALFHKAMQSVTSLADQEILAAFPWNKYRSIVDIGGGNGAFLQSLGRHLRLRNASLPERAVLDLPHAAKAAPQNPDGTPAEDVRLICGDFFNLDELAVEHRSLLAEADLIVLKHILHDWNDAECVKILRQIHAAISPQAKVLIIETLSTERKIDLVSTFADLEMMHSFQSKERSLEDFENLLEQSGFGRPKATHNLSPFALLLSAPVSGSMAAHRRLLVR